LVTLFPGKEQAINMSKRAKVLYIEDDNASQRLIQRLLGNYGYEVFVASDGLQGVTLAREVGPDIILMDINLPHIDGRSVTTRLRSLPNFYNLPIVALTANNSPGHRELALAAGCTGFLTKPIDVDHFPEQIEAFLQGHHHLLSQEDKQIHLERHVQQIVENLENKVRELESANNRLTRLERMKTDFLTIASHELRTPLTLISGYSNLLEKRLKMENSDALAPVVVTAERLNQGVQRMQYVVDEIIRVSRVSSGLLDLQIEPITLTDIARYVKEYFQGICEERELTIHFDDSLQTLPPLHVDGTQIKTALENVVGNAIKYTPNGGDIYLSARRNEQWVMIMVRDTGIGIPKQEQQRIFEQFYVLGSLDHHSTSKYAYRGGGLGVGLAIAKGIMEAHEGRIWVDSPGQDEETLPGSTFYLALPAQKVIVKQTKK
jgi:signal transduction histidine kinase